MTHPTCRRCWEASALDDGRLTEPDRSSFERHARSCEECGRELASLAALRRHVDVAAVPQVTEIEHRRARRRLLRVANERAVRPSLAPARAALALGAVFVVGAAATLVVGPLRSERLTARREDPSPLPDRPAVVAAPALPTGAGLVAASGASPPAALPNVSARSAHHEAAPPRPTAGQLFDEGVASFERGAYELADAQLERFAREHGEDPRAEDAAYLRAVARFRLGDRAGAAQLARVYLVAYPGGLRRPEAARIAGK